MLISVVLVVTPERDAVVPAHPGEASYSFALGRLDLACPGLGTRIYEWDDIKPLTCSALMGSYVRQRGMARVRAGERYWLRLTGLTQEVSAALLASIVENPPAIWDLDVPRARVAFVVTDVVCDGLSDGWSGQTSYEELVWRSMSRKSPGPGMQRLSLQFASPTTFSSAEFGSTKMQAALPLPGLLFGSLADRWNAFCPEDLGLQPWLREYSQQWVEMSEFDLKSVLVPIKKRRHLGAVGTATYTNMYDGEDSRWWKSLQILADYALYSGIGNATAVGMGQVRRRPTTG